ncbi:MAG TPA: ABC transporter permease [Vicinamibacterales bacterium]|nr:ABC transporter permease [Vicinamibacterales bacterium]
MLIQDLLYAARTLRMNLGFTAVAITCLALAIGLNTMIFSIVNGVLLEPLPFADPDRLMMLNESNPPLGVRRTGVSYANLRDWRDRSRSFSTIAGVQQRSLTIADRGEPERYSGAAISWEVFSTLGVRPALGRDFMADDDRPGAEPVVLLSDEVWRVRYSADRTIAGRSLLVDGRPHTVVGVLPPDFEFPMAQKVWVPLAPLVNDEPRDRRGLMTVARLSPGVSIEVAQEELRAVAAGLASEFQENDRWTALVRPIEDDFIPEEVDLILWTMMGAVTLVLVIACANVANLMLARAAARRREISIRAAIGAGRFRIARQLLTEAILLALLAVPPGIALAYVGNDLVRRAMPPDNVPYTVQWEISWMVLLYTVAIALGTGILFGLAPALQTANLNLQSALKEGGRGTGGVGPRTRLRSALVICEVGLALVLLVGASLFVRSFLNLRDIDVGFDVTPLMTLRTFMSGDAYSTEEARMRRVEEIVRAIETVPGVAAAFASNWVPLSGGGGGGRILIEGRTWPAGEEPFFGFTAVTPHFLRTLNVQVTRGRAFTEVEGQRRHPVAIISEGMAERFWPNEDPVGRQFRLTDPQITDSFTIIGVIRNIRHFQVDPVERETAHAYVPYPYAPTPNTGLTIRVAAGEPAAITPAVRAEIRRLDSGIPLFNVQSMPEVKRLGSWQFGLFGWMFSAFGAVALLLAVTGVYGLLAYTVSQRTQEIGVRVALGASRPDVVRLIVGQGLRLAGAGIVVGLIGALGVTHVVASLLYNITPTDPATFVGASLFLIGVAMVASYVPTRRATAVDPLIALRAE